MLQKHLLDFRCQPGIFSTVVGSLPATPSIRAALGTLKRFAQQGDRVLLALQSTRVKLHRWPREKRPLAFLKRSRSCRRRKILLALSLSEFFFLWSVMPTSRKGLLTLLAEELTPLMEGTLAPTQIACQLRERLLTRWGKLDRFSLQFLRNSSLSSLAWPFPSRWRVHFFKFPFHFFLGQDQMG
jgi:hypothetical protein